MCVSSSLTCGSCLANWNGKAWEESYKCILVLKTWTLVLNKERQLCVEGQCDLNLNITVCFPITDYLTRFWITSDNALVKLIGDFDTRDVPEYVSKKFSDGIPANWKEIGEKWVQYIQQGEKGAFDWKADESFTSSNTSILLAKIGGNIPSGRNGKTKEKSTQSTQQETSKTRTRETERDSAICSADGGSSKQIENVTSETFACPWLPAHKVQEINQWIDCSHVSPAPLTDLEIDAGNRHSLLDLIRPSDSTGGRTNENRREQFSERVARNPTNVVPQSTPICGEHNKRSAAQALSFDLSSIINISGDSLRELTSSAESDCMDGVFRKPNIALPSGKVAISKNNVRESNLKISQTQPSESYNSEGTDKHANQMFVSLRKLSRLRRKQTIQKIERWRPVLGVDGNLKVQGYLLLSGDMTAGQVLTTNTVLQWGFRKVETCDGREYELIGDPYEKIPEDLRNRLLKPISCEEIIRKLRTFQSLKEDVASCPYLAPPPTPMTINLTRSGRMCRPRVPYWLNRSDWGAEYELFYGNDSAYGTNSSRISSNTSRRETRASRSIPSMNQGSDSEVVRTPSSACEVTKTLNIAKDRLSGNLQECISSSESMNSCTSPIRKSSRISERQLQGKYRTLKNKRRRKTNGHNFILNSSSESEEINEVNKNDSATENIERGRNVRNSVDEMRLSSENVNSKSLQNQMMLPSLHLANQSSIVHFSPSRIKVSYLSNSPNTGQKAVQTIPQSPAERSMLDGSTDTSEDLLTLKQLQTLNEPDFCQFVPRSSQILRTPVRVASQSPVSRVIGKRSLQSLDTRNLSAPAGLANKTSTNPVTKIVSEVPAIKSPTKSAFATKTPTISSTTKTPTVTTATQKPIKRTTKTPGLRTTNKNLSKKTVTKSPATATTTTNTETPVTKVSKIPVIKSRSTRTPSESQITKTPTSKTKNSKTPIAKITIATSKTSSSNTAESCMRSSDLETPNDKIATTETFSYKSPTIEISSSKAPSSKTRKGSSVKRRGRSTSSEVTSVGKTPASNYPRYLTRNSASGSRSCKRITKPWVVVTRLEIKRDPPNAEEINEKPTPKTVKTKSSKEIKPVTKKIGSPKSTTKKGRGKNSKEDPKKKTTKAKTTKETKKTTKVKKTTKKASLFQSSDENDTTDDSASDCSNVSDMSVGPSASVVFAMGSPISRRAPRTLKERRERDEQLAQMGRRLAITETVGGNDDDDDPMAHLFAAYKFASIPEEWCKHENILRQNRKRRRPSSSDGTASPHSAFDDGFGNEDATSSVATPQLLMKPPDPKQVQSYLQRQRALNSRPQRPTRPVHKNTNLAIPDIDYRAIFCPSMSDSEESSMVSDAD